MNIENKLPNTSDIETVLGLDAASRRSRRLRSIAWALAAFGLLAGGFWWYLGQVENAAKLSYKTQAAVIHDLQVTITATGTTEPTQVVDISSELSGVVRRVAVDYNDSVKQDDILAELDIERRKAQRDRAQATVNAAKARAKEAQATATERALALQRFEQLSLKGFSPQGDLDAARAASARAIAALASSEADLAVAEADLLLQETDLEKSYIRSPIDGVVLKRAVEPGQTVASSFQAPVLFIVAGDLRAMRVEADIDEADIGSVTKRQQATFTVDAYPGREFPAVVSEIYFAPQTVEGVVTYKAILTVDNDDLLLRPGMTATARVIVRDISQALVIPNAALRYTPPKENADQSVSFIRRLLPRMPRLKTATENLPMRGERVVYRLKDGAVEPVNVKVGASDGIFSQIEPGGIAEGDLLIVDASTSGN